MFYGWEKVESIQVLKLLKQVKKLFSVPTNWFYWPIAVNASGVEVCPSDADASKWSLMGACDLYSTKEYNGPMAEFVSCATREYLNDLSDDKLIHGGFSYEDELALIDLAIEDLEKEISNESEITKDT